MSEVSIDARTATICYSTGKSSFGVSIPKHTSSGSARIISLFAKKIFILIPLLETWVGQSKIGLSVFKECSQTLSYIAIV